MDVRKKLVELLREAPYNIFGNKLGNCYFDSCLELIADHLTSHGVTVQEWTSVKDRLPEDDSDVLAYSRIGEESRIYPACYSNGVWFDCVFNAPATDTTTHWMPFPQPPKGE